MHTEPQPDAGHYRGRFAPSPTGAMHLGLARTALLAWLRARSRAGAFVLRIEDIDGPRVVPGAAEALLADLRFLGLDWDEGPDVGGAYGPYVQSQRLARYVAALEQLRQAARVYPCSCTRKELSVASAPHGPSEFGPPYAGHCRAAPRRRDVPYALRFRVPEALPELCDRRLGPVVALAQGDFVVQRADGTVSYQLAVVVDDMAMQISEVVRGEDLAGCTGWQLALYEALGGSAPAFCHVPLLVDTQGRRFSKRDKALSIAALRAASVRPEALVGALAASVGLVPEGSVVSARELLQGFAVERVCETPIDWQRALSYAGPGL